MYEVDLIENLYNFET